MKRLLIFLFITTTVQMAMAQHHQPMYKPFKIDIAVGYADPQGSGSKAGFLAAVEPKFAIMEELAVGLRMEAAITARADGSGAAGDVHANASYLATGDYYIMRSGFRPFVGGGLGTYTFASETISVEGGGTVTIDAANLFGYMLRTGFEAGHFRLGLEYNFIPATNSGSIKNSYFGIKIGGFFGGGRTSQEERQQ